MKRITKPAVKDITIVLAKQQNYICPLCGRDLRKMPNKDWVLDHDHKSGDLRSVLCRNCNGMEGKVLLYANRAKAGKTVRDWLVALLKYYEHHANNPSNVKHYTYETEEEKRANRNAKARLARAKKKAAANLAKKKE